MTEYIADIIEDAGLGTQGTDIFISSIPESPDNVICIYDDAGIVSDYQSDYASDWKGVMIMARGSYGWANEKIWQVHRYVAGLNNDEVVTTVIQTPPAQIGIDDKGRREFTVHYMFLTTPKESENRILLFKPVQTFDETFDDTFA